MSKSIGSVFLVFSLLAIILIPVSDVQAQSSGQPTKKGMVTKETQDQNIREISSSRPDTAPQQVNIGFIDSPSATCYQPDKGQDICYINWYYLSVNASPNYMIYMNVTIDAIGLVARLHGFFQTSMYAPYNMFDRGFKVACGAAGSGGNPDLGMAYAFTIRAEDSAALKSANYGTVYCPPFIP
jgi:hypothetical protein